MFQLIEKRLSESVVELSDLFNSHMKEVLGLGYEFKPDYNAYEQLEEMGACVFIVAYNLDGAPIGYCSYILNPSLHFKGKMYGVQDLLYVSKEYRGGGLGFELVKQAEHLCKDSGCSLITLTSKVGSKSIRGIAIDGGYTEYETSYIKEI